MSIIDVSELISKVKGDVLVPGDEGYEEAIVRWSDSATKRAGVVVLVNGPEDVAAAVSFPNRN